MSLLTVLALAAALCAALALFKGVASMAHGGATDQSRKTFGQHTRAAPRGTTTVP